MFLKEVGEVVRLEDHVTEFGVTDALVAVREAVADRVFLHHHVDGEKLPDIAEGVEVGDRSEPIGVVEGDRAIGERGRIVQQAAEDPHLGFDIGRDLLGGKHRPLGGLAAGIADQAGAASRDDDGGVPGPLQVGEHHDRDQVTDRQGIGGWVIPDVPGAGAGCKVRGQPALVGALSEEVPPSEFVNQVHEGEG